MRIVSLLPAVTEIICKLGFEDQLVGRSHECDQPLTVQDLPAVTRSSVNNSGNSKKIDQSIRSILENGLSVFNVNSDLLSELNPDIIFTQDQCEVCAVSLKDVKTAAKKVCSEKTKIVSVSPTELSEIFEAFKKIGTALNADKSANDFVDEIQQRMDILRKTVIGEPVKRVACIEWIEPLMVSGNWIPELLEIVGAEYLLSNAGKHSPNVNWEDLLDENPDVILAMPCGYSIDQTLDEMKQLTDRKHWNSIKAVNDDEVYVLDGNHYFNRPGPTIFESARILGEILHPKLFKPIHLNKGWIPFRKDLEAV